MVDAENQYYPTWEKDCSAEQCYICDSSFWLLLRRHHCRQCGFIICYKCSMKKNLMYKKQGDVNRKWRRVCDVCHKGKDNKLFQLIKTSNTADLKKVVNPFQQHEDSKKLLPLIFQTTTPAIGGDGEDAGRSAREMDLLETAVLADSDAVETLLESGAFSATKVVECAFLAVESDKRNALEVFLNHPNGVDASAMYPAKASKSEEYGQNHSLLMSAAFKNRPECIEILLKNGADHEVVLSHPGDPYFDNKTAEGIAHTRTRQWEANDRCAAILASCTDNQAWRAVATPKKTPKKTVAIVTPGSTAKTPAAAIAADEANWRAVATPAPAQNAQ